eukprot:Rhum_TRINITY_DN13187_c0_g1::Rhum_TRINITY_DN13187_c0_g1_i1::g.57648::m.57648
MKLEKSKVQEGRVGFVSVCPTLDVAAVASGRDVTVYRMQLSRVASVTCEGDVTTLCWGPSGKVLAVGTACGLVLVNIEEGVAIGVLCAGRSVVHAEWTAGERSGGNNNSNNGTNSSSDTQQQQRGKPHGQHPLRQWRPFSALESSFQPSVTPFGLATADPACEAIRLKHQLIEDALTAHGEGRCHFITAVTTAAGGGDHTLHRPVRREGGVGRAAAGQRAVAVELPLASLRRLRRGRCWRRRNRRLAPGDPVRRRAPPAAPGGDRVRVRAAGGAGAHARAARGDGGAGARRRRRGCRRRGNGARGAAGRVRPVRVGPAHAGADGLLRYARRGCAGQGGGTLPRAALGPSAHPRPRRRGHRRVRRRRCTLPARRRRVRRTAGGRAGRVGRGGGPAAAAVRRAAGRGVVVAGGDGAGVRVAHGGGALRRRPAPQRQQRWRRRWRRRRRSLELRGRRHGVRPEVRVGAAAGERAGRLLCGRLLRVARRLRLRRRRGGGGGGGARRSACGRSLGGVGGVDGGGRGAARALFFP